MVAIDRQKALKKLKERKAKMARVPGHVLLVEDDAILAMALEDAFQNSGTREITVCQTMQATMEALQDGAKPDAIVIDVHLADRSDGWAIAELVSLLGPRTPRIAFSTGSPEAIPENIAGMGQVFTKPYDPEELVRYFTAEEGLGSRFSFLRR